MLNMAQANTAKSIRPPINLSLASSSSAVYRLLLVTIDLLKHCWTSFSNFAKRRLTFKVLPVFGILTLISVAVVATAKTYDGEQDGY